LHLAALVGNKEIFQLLVENGANLEIKAKDQPGGTPLQWAAFWGVNKSVEFIIAAGANVNAKDNNGCTPLCATIVPNPFVEEQDKANFKNRIVAIQHLLKANGGRVE
jgi:ankyrin repeat protein